MTNRRSGVITWPPPFVQLRKVARGGAQAQPSGDPRAYRYGKLNSHDSLPVNYSITGWLLRSPAVGESVHVLRVSRNTTVMPGIFVTTEVVKVPHAGEFHTTNSIYYWSEVAETPQSIVSLPVPMPSGMKHRATKSERRTQ